MHILRNVYMYFYILILTTSIISLTALNILHINFLKLLIIEEILGIFLSLYILIVNKESIKFLLGFILLIFVLIFKYVFNWNIFTLRFLFFIYMVMNIKILNIHMLIKRDCEVKLFVLIALAIMTFFGFINIPIVIGVKNGLSLGFFHPNILGEVILSLLLSSLIIIFTKYRKTRISSSLYYISLFVMAMICLMSYYFTGCRELIYAGMTFILCLACYKVHFFHSLVYALPFILMILGVFITFIFSYKYNPSNLAWYRLNKLFSQRIYIQSITLKLFPLKLVGRHISHLIFYLYTNDSVDSTIDNSYINNAYSSGIIGLVIIVFVLLRMSWLVKKYKNYLSCSILIAFSILSIVSSSLFAIYLDVPLLYVIYKCINHINSNDRKEKSL